MVRLFILIILIVPFFCNGQTMLGSAPPIDSRTCSNSASFYPSASRLLRESGRVVLSFYVESNGEIASPNVVRSSGSKRLDDAAKVLLMSCKGKPSLVDGEFKRSSGHLEVIWSLDPSIDSECPRDLKSNNWSSCFGTTSDRDGRYSGYFKMGKPSGFGVLSQTSGAQYVGNFTDGKPDGLGIQYASNGTVIASGNWVEGSLSKAEDIKPDLLPFDSSFANQSNVNLVHARLIRQELALQAEEREKEKEREAAEERRLLQKSEEDERKKLEEVRIAQAKRLEDEQQRVAQEQRLIEAAKGREKSLITEVETERKKRQELETQLVEAKEREKQLAEAKEAGSILISPKLDLDTVRQLGIDMGVNLRRYPSETAKYLQFHRELLFMPG